MKEAATVAAEDRPTVDVENLDDSAQVTPGDIKIKTLESTVILMARVLPLRFWELGKLHIWVGAKIMKTLKTLVLAAVLSAFGSPAHATLIDFKALADGSLGESAWTTLMFEVDGSHTTNAADAFLSITGSNGNNSFAYLDSRNAGLGVCGALLAGKLPNTAFPNSKTNLCDPSSDDNITYHSGNPETAHFVFAGDVVIDTIWLNNNHDGDTSLLNDFFGLGVGGPAVATQLTNGGPGLDSSHHVGLFLTAGQSLDIGFWANQTCGGSQYDNCELYISKIEFHRVPEPSALALLGLGLAGVRVLRRRKR